MDLFKCCYKRNPKYIHVSHRKPAPPKLAIIPTRVETEIVLKNDIDIEFNWREVLYWTYYFQTALPYYLLIVAQQLKIHISLEKKLFVTPFSSILSKMVTCVLTTLNHTTNTNYTYKYNHMNMDRIKSVPYPLLMFYNINISQYAYQDMQFQDLA